MVKQKRRSVYGVFVPFLLLFAAVCWVSLTIIDKDIAENRRQPADAFASMEGEDYLGFLNGVYGLLNKTSNDTDGTQRSVSPADLVKQMGEIMSKCGKAEKIGGTLTLNRNWNGSMLSFVRKQLAIFLVKRGRSERNGPTLNHQFDTSDIRNESSSYKRLANALTSQGLYEEGLLLEEILHDMAHKPIIFTEDISDTATSLKFKLTLEGGIIGVFKPKRVERDYVVPPDIYYMDEIPRHFATIATFYLDRLLGLRMVPPSVGRLVNIQKDILPYASEEFNETFYISPAGNDCFYGLCSHFCSPRTPVCSSKGLLEGSFSIFLPDSTHITSHRNPWSRTYARTDQLAKWQQYPSSYCLETILKRGMSRGRRLLDLIDVHILDFLTGNADRHHYDTPGALGLGGFVIAIDNDSGFGRPEEDDILILSPLKQCCKIRLSTLEKLLSHTQMSSSLQGTPTLTESMQKLLRQEPGLPEAVLTHAHLKALDRRLAIVLRAVSDCLNGNRDVIHVIIDDGY